MGEISGSILCYGKVALWLLSDYTTHILELLYWVVVGLGVASSRCRKSSIGSSQSTQNATLSLAFECTNMFINIHNPAMIDFIAK